MQSYIKIQLSNIQRCGKTFANCFLSLWKNCQKAASKTHSHGENCAIVGHHSTLKTYAWTALKLWWINVSNIHFLVHVQECQFHLILRGDNHSSSMPWILKRLFYCQKIHWFSLAQFPGLRLTSWPWVVKYTQQHMNFIMNMIIASQFAQQMKIDLINFPLLFCPLSGIRQ